MIRTSLINGVINLDSDFSKYIESLSNPWVIEGFNVQDWVVKPWKARVKAERTNGETIYCYVENTEDVSLSWNDGKVYIVIDQEDIDSGLVSEDWSNIARIEEGDVRPVKNFLKIWSKNGGLIVDEREMVKTIESVQEDIESISEDVEVIDWKIEQIETQGVPTSALTETWVVGELYTLDDELYLQDVSEDLDLTEWVTVINVWYDKEETHIQRIANGISWNSISLYIAKVGSPVTNFNVEIRKGIYAEADWRAYWTGDENEIIVSKTISYSWITTDFQKITIVFDENIELQKGELIDVVCYQTGVSDEKIKSTTDYFTIEWYGYKLGEWNSVNYVDNAIITPTTYIAYCSSDIFENRVFSKVDRTTTITAYYTSEVENSISGVSPVTIREYNATQTPTNLSIKWTVGLLQYNERLCYKIDWWAEVVIWSTWSNTATINVSQQITFNNTFQLYAYRYSWSTSSANYEWNLEMFYNGASTNKQNIIWKPTSILPVSSEMSVVTEWNVNGEWFSQGGGDLLKPLQNQEFKLNKDAIMVCQFSHTISAQNSATFKIKQDWNDYRIWSWWGWSSWNYSNGIFLNQTVEYRLRWWHIYQIDFTPSLIKEFYLVD